MLVKTESIISGFFIVLLGFSLVGYCVPTEIPVNTYTSSYQGDPSVAMDSVGNFVVTWDSDGQDGSGFGIFAQLYDSNGNTVGSEFPVNTYTTSYQWIPAVAMDSDGDFVITWSSYGQDGDGIGVYAQRFNSSGVAQGSEFLVNTYTTSYQESPAVAMDSVGNFVIAWASYEQDGSEGGIYAQRFNSSGVPQGSEFPVNTYTTNYQDSPSVAMDSDGDFVITWNGEGSSDTLGVYAQRYNSSGVPQGVEFRVNTYTTESQELATIAMNSNGDFVIVWSSNGQDGSEYGIYAQLYDNAGITVGSEFRVNTYTTSFQDIPYVAMDSIGNFIVTWSSYEQDGSEFGVYAQLYENGGSPIGSEFKVNTYTTDYQWWSSAAMNSTGDFVIAWQSYNQVSGSSDDDVFAKFYEIEDVNAITLESFKAHSEGKNVILEWSTGTEIDNLGYYIVRSESTDDGYVLVNKSMIPAKGNVHSGYEYKYVDSDVNAGHVYYYWLADLDVYGKYEIHGPVMVVTNLEVKF